MKPPTPKKKLLGRRLAMLTMALALLVLGLTLFFWLRDYLEENRLIDQVAKGQSRERLEAIERLAEKGSLRALPILLRLKTDQDNDEADGARSMIESLIHEAIDRIIEKRGPEAVRALAGGLLDGERAVRSAALDVLLDLGPRAKAAIPLLAQALQDPETSVRLKAARALFEAGAEPDLFLPALMEALQSGDCDDRGEVANSLFFMERPLSPWLPNFLECLKKHAEAALWNPDLQSVIDAPFLLLGKEAVPALRALLGDVKAPVRRAATRALGKLGGLAREAVPELIDMAKSSGEDVEARQAAVTALGEIGPAAQAAVPVLVEMLSTKNMALRCQAAAALGKLGPAAAAAVPALLECVGYVHSVPPHYAPSSRYGLNLTGAALEALGRIHADAGAVLPRLRRSLSFDDEYLRIKAVKALLAYGPEAREALPELEIRFRDPCITVSIWAGAAVAAIAPERAPPLIDEILQAIPHWPDSGWKSAAFKALGKLGPAARKAVPLLIKQALLESPKKPHVDFRPSRWRALDALDSIGFEAGDLRPLIEAIEDPDHGRRLRAAQALGRLGPAARCAAPTLQAALEERGSGPRQAARWALRQIEPQLAAR